MCTAVDEFLAELETRMAAATRADGVHPPLTAEALQVIAAADHGGTPMYTSANLARIAKENGVDVSSDMTPNDIIAELRRRPIARLVALPVACARIALINDDNGTSCS